MQIPKVKTMFLALLSSAILLSAAPGQEQSDHQMRGPETLEWGPVRNGLSVAIAEGNPQAPGAFTMMLRLADGAWIPPHFHNVEKRLVVIEGTLLMGTGQEVEPGSAQPLQPGGVAVVPAESWHYEGAKGRTLIALIAEGPFQTTFASSPSDNSGASDG